MSIARIKIEKGNEHLPTLIKIQFSPEVWNFVVNDSFLLARYSNMSEEESQIFEVREAIRKASNLIEKELYLAAEDQLGIKL